MILHHLEDADALLAAFSGPLDARMDALMAGYTTQELATVQRFLAEATGQLDEYRRRFTAEG
jgi:hypothetical protein